VRSSGTSSPPPAAVFGGGLGGVFGRAAPLPFGRRVPTPLIVKKIEWSPAVAAEANGFEKASDDGPAKRVKTDDGGESSGGTG